MYIHNHSSNFTQREIAAAIHVWNRAAISLLDIRHNLISPEEALQGYRLPASSFVYTSGGKAEVLLNDTAYNVERFGLFHGAKGTELTILPKSSWLEYYMVLYKAGEPPFHRREFATLLGATNPFRQQFGFQPENPIFVAELLRKMYEKWKGPTPLDLFYGKSAFYQLVYAVYESLEQGCVRVFEPDSIAMAKRYLDEHFGDDISMQELCEILGMSYSHFYKSFKERTGTSPQEYLIGVRLTAATHWLQDSDVPIRAIADSTGFANERNFYRTFAKHYGMSPNTFRQNASRERKDYAIGSILPFPYNWESWVSPNELRGKGATHMLKQIQSKAVVAAALSLMLLLSACGTSPASVNADSAPASSVSSQMSETEATDPVEESTRVIPTILGDVEVPANPQRIVVSGFWVGDVLALGKEPVAIQDFYVTTSSWAEQAKNVTVLEKWEPEYIMALEPDLIITATFGQNKPEDYDNLSQIAPTVAFDWSDEPETRLPVMAQVLGLEATAGDALVNEYNQKIVDYRKKLEDAGMLDKTITIFRNDGVVDGGMELGGEIGWGGEVVYTLFGMPMPEGVKALREQENASGNVSFEVIPELCGDYILLNQNNPEHIKKLEENPIWQAIPAVQKGNILSVEPGKVYFPDIISDTYKLEVISEALLALAAKQ